MGKTGDNEASGPQAVAPGGPRLLVAFLTYDRADNLWRLLDRMKRMTLPRDASVEFACIDNHPDATARPMIEGWKSDRRFHYVHEPEPGIPLARNAALDFAHRHAFDLLAFIDDDEYPESGWLVQLMATRRETKANLIGGPVLRIQPVEQVAARRRWLAASLYHRDLIDDGIVKRKIKAGKPVTIHSGNCLIDLDFVRRAGVRFPDDYRFSGGSDAKFSRDMIAAGATLAWTDKAIAYEPFDPGRLTLGYQFGRSRSTGRNAARLENVSLAKQTGRLLLGAGMMLVPVLGRASFATGLHLVGTSLGRMEGRKGARSTLYRRTDDR